MSETCRIAEERVRRVGVRELYVGVEERREREIESEEEREREKESCVELYDSLDEARDGGGSLSSVLAPTEAAEGECEKTEGEDEG